MKLYVRDNCEYCKAVQIPQDLDIEIVSIDSMPFHTPTLHCDNFVMQGPNDINNLFKLITNAREGRYHRIG